MRFEPSTLGSLDFNFFLLPRCFRFDFDGGFIEGGPCYSPLDTQPVEGGVMKKRSFLFGRAAAVGCCCAAHEEISFLHY